jgi:UDP-N-acetylglucosamine--N-acetylmuramyl-(pentapeptide) pyrophosphoryl-undecaprenol N-acetylglucosamine transferase
MKLFIAGGGTGGHVSPGLAVASVWQARHGKRSVIWVGRTQSIEERMAKAAGLAFAALEARPLKRSLDPKNLLLPISLLKGFRQAWKILAGKEAAVVLVTGGYVSVPTALAAVLRNLPLVLIEPNAVLGIANRFFAGAAGAICMAYPMPKPRPNMVITGNPVRFKSRLPSRDGARKKLNLDKKMPLLLVLPGSGAAHSINLALGQGLKKLKDLQLLWMTGPADHAKALAAVKEAKIKAQVLPFIEDVSSAYAAADLVLARCGASMLAEIALAGKPSILVPYPYATGDHQRLNALGFAEHGAARMLLDSELDGGRLCDEIRGLMADPDLLKRMGAAARKLGKSDAAENVAGVLNRVAKGFNYV